VFFFWFCARGIVRACRPDAALGLPAAKPKDRSRNPGAFPEFASLMRATVTRSYDSARIEFSTSSWCLLCVRVGGMSICVEYGFRYRRCSRFFFFFFNVGLGFYAYRYSYSHSLFSHSSIDNFPQAPILRTSGAPAAGSGPCSHLARAAATPLAEIDVGEAHAAARAM